MTTSEYQLLIVFDFFSRFFLFLAPASSHIMEGSLRTNTTSTTTTNTDLCKAMEIVELWDLSRVG